MSDLIKREDAIEAIQTAYCTPCKKRGDDYNEVRCRACEFDDAMMQIDSVPSAEPKWELISRDDAVAIVLMCSRICNLSEQEKWDKCAKTINSLSPAEAEWIPVSERLPSEYGEYLATVDGETIEVTYVPETKGLVKGWSTCDAYGYKGLLDDDVIAWRPKPTPYKGE